MKRKLLCATFVLLGTNAFAQNLVAHWDFDAPHVNMTPAPGGIIGTVTENVHGWVGNLYSANGAGQHIAGDPLGGPNNGAIWFAPTSWLRVPHDPAMDIQSWTIRVVFKNYDCASTPDPAYCQTGILISRGVPGSNGHYGITFGDDPADNNCNQVTCAKSVFMAQAAGPEMISTGTTYATQAWLGYPATNPKQPVLLYGNQQWNCLVASYDAQTRDITLSINGIEYVRKEWSPTNQYSTSPTPGDMFIGNSHLAIPGSGGIFNQLNAAIDDIKIWDGVFTNQADIAALCGCQAPTMVAHWDFDNGNTTELVHGWSNISTTPPTTIVADMNGIPNGAVKFNSGEFLQYAYDPAMNLTAWTITARVRPDVYNPQYCESSAILWRGASYSSDAMGLVLTDNAFDLSCGSPLHPNNSCFAGMAAGNMGAGAGQWLVPAAKTNPFINWGQWYCVTMTYDPNVGEVKAYIDGTHVATAPWSNQYSFTTPGPDLFIGASGIANFEYLFDGAIDDIRIFDGAYCPGEVANLCCSALTPIARWDFQNGSTQESINGWNDVMGTVVTPVNGFDATPGEAVHFNRGDYLKFPHDPKMDLTSWTITAVVKPTSWDPNQHCQSTSILSKGAEYADNCYGMIISDNPFDNENCDNYDADHMLFTGFAAGHMPGPASQWQGGLNNPAGIVSANPFINIINPQWYCVAITYDAVEGRIMAFVDGVKRASMKWHDQYANPMSPADLFIGSSANPGGMYPYFFEGDIDEIRLYSGTLCHSRLPICPRIDRNQFLKPTNINDAVTGKVDIVPNPANGAVTITVPNGWSDVSYTLTNSVGMTVQSGSLIGKTTLDVSNLASGMYMITTHHQGQSSVQKLVIQH